MVEERVKNPNTTKKNYQTQWKTAKTKKENYKTSHKTINKVQHLSIITLSVNGWNSPIRRESGWLD